MTRPAYTPGPWFAHPNKYCDGEWLVQAGMPTNRVLANFGSRDPLDDTDIANAHLIAAAPELLEALKGLLTHCGIADVATEDKDAEDHALERAARDAIAKAGQS